jgi:hypothetical protein
MMMLDPVIRKILKIGVTDVRIFAQMAKITAIVPFMPIALSNPDDRTWVECTVSETRYSVSEGYKITLCPVFPHHREYAMEHYYQSDFQRLYEFGMILFKTEEGQHVERIKWIEQIPGSNACFVHEADVVVDKKGKIVNGA